MAADGARLIVLSGTAGESGSTNNIGLAIM
jgi:hypothetical protein